MPYIEVCGLIKTFRVAQRRPGIRGALRGLVYRRHKSVGALQGVSFSIDKGELVGYIGPNGAGKSTTVKILSGILVPDSGSCSVDGMTPWKNRLEHVQRIGVVFGQRTQLWWDLPVVESFDLLRDIYRIPDQRYRFMKDFLVERIDVGDLLDVPVRQLSLGQRMRCDLVAALLHEPQLLFLDEPTIGLDAISKLAVRDFVRALNREKAVTVILTTHDLDDIEVLCERLIVINKGRIVMDGPISDLRSRLKAERRLTLDLEDEEQSFSDPNAVLLKREGHRLFLSFDPEEVSSSELVRRIRETYRVKDIYLENPPIEEIVAALYADKGHR